MIIINFLTAINFIIFNTGNFIENEFVRVETKWNLYEETKKKLIYEVSFNIINKKGSEIYYTASRVKNIQNINNMNSSSSDVSNENFVNSRTQGVQKLQLLYRQVHLMSIVEDLNQLTISHLYLVVEQVELMSQKGNQLKKMMLIKNLLSHIIFLPIFFLLTTLTLKTSNFLFMGKDEKITNLISDSQEIFSSQYSIK